MRLTGIKLAGFKSFVEPTRLDLPSSLTAIVGPNGSGKSNLIDAVRWVLGENSPKLLRGGESEDVIFSGSKLRKPAGRASVELVFDNGDGALKGPYAGYTEISVRRELVRGEDAQYFLNGNRCLKRDVVDLFLGTGLGGRNQYAILEQGTIQRLVDAKPEELRLWVEEVAGISKYKDRRRETESRIRATRDNLARLADLQGEVTQRLEVLQRQAGDAEKFKQLKAQERRLRAELLLLRDRQLQASRDDQLQAIERAEAVLADARAGLAAAEAERAASDAALREHAQRLNACQGEVYQAESRLAQEQQALQHLRELAALRERERQALETQRAELNRRLQRERTQREQLLHARAEADRQFVAAAQAEAVCAAEVESAEAELTAEQARWEAFSQRAEAPLLQAEAERVRRQSLERALAELDERLSHLHGELAGLDLDASQRELARNQDAVRALDTELQQGGDYLQRLDRELTALREQRAGDEAALHEARQSLQDARGRRASLETLQQAALREDDADLSQWLQRHGWQGRPRLAGALRVEAGWEAAVEHVLGDLLQAPLIPGLDVGAADSGPVSGASLIADGGTDRPPAPDSLAAKVQGPAAVRRWLEPIRVAADARQAAAMLAEARAGVSVVTADGVWRASGWVRYPRRPGEQGGVLARGLLLQQLQEQVERISLVVREREQALEALQSRLSAAEAQRREAAAVLDQARARHARLLADRQAASVRAEQQQQRAQALAREIEALAERRRSHDEELAAASRRLEQAESAAERLRGERGALSQALAAARERLTAARARLADATQARGQTQLRLGSQSSTLEALEAVIRELETQLQSLAGRPTAATPETPNEPSLVAVEARVAQARDQLTAAREALQHARGELTAAEARAQAAQHALRQAEAHRDAAVERLQQARLEHENLRAHHQALAEQIDELLGDSGEDRQALSAELPTEATVEAWEQRLAQTLRRVERLGAINLAAIGELDEARARADYLQGQRRDLEEALATLETAMHRLDRETETLFRDTFERLNLSFAQACERLFGGGEAHLEMTGDELLTTGVRVMVRPPGKRNASIQMLSGGEKSMAALALLFALFALNPAPFCLLDEVEAPLDDANVMRFCELVRDMSAQVQFIIITHNKITMELATHLHGVTMQEPGVSRLVSVDVEQAVRLAGEVPETSEAA